MGRYQIQYRVGYRWENSSLPAYINLNDARAAILRINTTSGNTIRARIIDLQNKGSK